MSDPLWSHELLACQTSLSFIISQSLFKLMCIESVIPSNHFILSHRLLILPSIFPSIRVFSNESVLHITVLGVSDSASVLLMNIQSWFPLGLTGLISLLSMGLSRVFSSNTIQKQLFFDIQHSLCSNSHIHTRLWLQTLFLSYLPIMLSMSNFPNSLCLLFLFSLHSLNLDFSYLHRYLVTYFCPNLFY